MLDRDETTDGYESDHCIECSVEYPVDCHPSLKSMHIMMHLVSTEHYPGPRLSQCQERCGTSVTGEPLACMSQTLRQCLRCESHYCTMHADSHICGKTTLDQWGEYGIPEEVR